MVAGIAEGRELGVQKGYEIGQEVGFYAGCIRTWRALQAKEPDLVTDRMERGLAALEEMIRDFPLYDPQVGRHTSHGGRRKHRLQLCAGCAATVLPYCNPDPHIARRAAR
ncbi:hypothetical protein Vretimale_1416 [Volvox reticuliferus]|uniref:Essential protein Yae1 N-terminal domain-containing protein n=1 Tax=Volvox reticuliferus TaxID=1737510 RepID=A0A8J4CG35_9CHLO|nr:hypothetical protein Vretifemale_10810 [Volvox reticuliferus]GIL95372.1 hypothetical protein Vretimale_1416 [Volvox reticuliferus]